MRSRSKRIDAGGVGAAPREAARLPAMRDERAVLGAKPVSSERSSDLLQLSERESQVLSAIVECHIESREPVGSKTLAARGDLRCSPATIRNVMSQLHQRGLIAQPHTSAGRVPTHLGLRFFVDCMLQIQLPPAHIQEEIATHVQEAGSVERALDEAGRVLARLSQKACIVGAPRSERIRLKQIDFVRLRNDALLVLLVTSEGFVQNRLLEVDARSPLLTHGQLPDQSELTRMGRYLSDRGEGQTLSELLQQLQVEHAQTSDELDRLRRSAAELGRVALSETGLDHAGLRVEGERHLLDVDDPKQSQRMQELLGLLDEKTQLVSLLDRACDAPGIRVFIGEENPLREFADMSVITASYGDGTRALGTLGVIGPTRMDYAKVVPLVEFTAQAVSRLLG